jgi:hypothetical protein
MKKSLLWVIPLVAALGLALPAQAVEFGVRGYYWFTDIEGNVKLSSGSLAGTKLDFDDLGIGNESYPVGEVFLGFGKHHLSFSYYHAKYSGTSTLSETINFGGETFVAGDIVKSSLEYDVYDLMYQYDLFDLKYVLGRFSMGVLAKVSLYDGDMEIRSQTLDQSEKESFTVPIPMAGLSLRLGILPSILEARVVAAGIGYSEGYAFDGEADLVFVSIPFVEIHGGYRIFRVHVDTNDLELHYDTLGPYVGAVLHL